MRSQFRSWRRLLPCAEANIHVLLRRRRDVVILAAPRAPAAWHAAYLRRSGCCRRRHLDDQVVLLDRNRKRLCDVRPLDEARASFDRHLELSRPYRFRIAPRLTRADVVFPAMPGAAQEFLLASRLGTHLFGPLA